VLYYGRDITTEGGMKRCIEREREGPKFASPNWKKFKGSRGQHTKPSVHRHNINYIQDNILYDKQWLKAFFVDMYVEYLGQF
jgi:hypothetical protein